MDAVRNNFSGKVHLAFSGADETLCLIRHLDNKIRVTYGVPAYDLLLSGATQERAVKAADCKRCIAIASQYH